MVFKNGFTIFAVRNTQSATFGDPWFEKVTPKKQEFVSDSPVLSRQTVPQRLQRDWMNPATVACWYHLLRLPDSFLNYILDFQIQFMVQMWLPTWLPFLHIENVPSSVWSLHTSVLDSWVLAQCGSVPKRLLTSGCYDKNECLGLSRKSPDPRGQGPSVFPGDLALSVCSPHSAVT